ncbi:MAG: MnmC family methyltransferase [Chthoniobacterales bacterium]
MFELVALRDGLHTLRDLETGETFHPVVGPMVEAEAIHIGPLDLETRMLGGEVFTIWDVGLGAAANAVALLEKLASMRVPFQCKLVSFDCTLEPLRFTLSHAAQLTYPLPWLAQLTELAEKNGTRITFENGGVLDWELCLGDFTTLPAAPAPDGIIYDPYSPAKNLPMWSLAHFSALRKRLTRPAVLTSYSRSTAVRVTLLLAGFYVGIGDATGEKEQTTVAATDLGLLKNPLPMQWLARVRMSTSARPLGSAKGPISNDDLRRLEAHPQF